MFSSQDRQTRTSSRRKSIKHCSASKDGGKRRGLRCVVIVEFTFPHRDRVSHRGAKKKVSEPVGRRKDVRSLLHTDTNFQTLDSAAVKRAGRSEAAKPCAPGDSRSPVPGSTGMGNSSSDRSPGVQGGQQAGKEPRTNILMDGSEDGDVFQREDTKVNTRTHTHTSSCELHFRLG